MSNTQPCFECGHSISKDAKECPNCRCRHLRGIRCGLCRKRMRVGGALNEAGKPYSSSDYVREGSHKTGLYHAYHPDCYRSLVPDPVRISCPDCGNAIRLEGKRRGRYSDVGVCTSLPTTPHLVVGRSACRVGVGPSLNRSWAQRSRPVVQAGRRAFPGDESVVD